IPVEDVKEGDLLLCDSGQVLPVDGVVVRGTSALDTSWLNGEPLPRWVEAGSEVEAGCMNAGAQLLVRATLPAHRSRIASLVADVERALLERSPLATLADVVSGRFTVVVLVLAAITFGIHVGTAGSAALQHALALLIVACPCALAMATPLALHVAVRQAARREILLLRGEALERLARPCTLILDKTGTLTLGRPTLVRWDGEPALRDVTRVAEARSHHPIARALLDGGTGESASPDVTDIREVLGRGVTALYRGQPFSAGSESFVRSSAELDEQAERWLTSGPAGASPLLVAWEGRVRAIGWIADPVRPGMAEVLAELRAMGHELVLASGDHPETVAQVAAQLTERSGNAGLFGRVVGGASPDDKRRLAEEAQGRRRTVVVIGDGVNDAAALATADVGIAVHGAAEAARLSADVFLGRNGALDLVTLLRSARRGLAVIRRGMFFSLLYNVVGIGAAMLGWLHPLWAAVLMPLSSISVVTNAFRSRIFPAPEKSS
ncbi:MAG TPA: heavy metal translocating P-type ATPase, partial [Polyangiaceae bacterium]|nr:heavy metal translocating P-type ATPase [Polyangiaceae bacterium]